MTLDLILVGYGNVGRRFAALLDEQRRSLKLLDDLDTRMSSFGQLFAAAPAGARWTDSKNIYGRQLLRGK